MLMIPEVFLNIEGGLTKDNYRLSTDSRSPDYFDLFAAIEGEKFKPLDFLQDLITKGCKTIICEQNSYNQEKVSVLGRDDVTIIWVQNTILYLQQLARLHIEDWYKSRPGRRVIGITGSNGKTTHKEMLSHLMSAVNSHNVLATTGNLNNHIGVPLTILKINPEHDYAIIEMGMNHSGEIKVLCDVALPNSGIITNIGTAHIEYLGSIEDIFIEKKTLFDEVKKNSPESGLFVVNGADKYLKKLVWPNHLIKFNSEDSGVTVSIDKNIINISAKGQNYSLSNNHIIGEHNFYNLAVCFLFALNIYPESSQVLIEATKAFKPRGNRSMVIERKNKKIFMDAYNANMDSMLASLNGYMDYLKQSDVNINDALYVIGDMNELGTYAEEYHKKIGAFVREQNLKNFVFVGRFSAYYCAGYNATCTSFSTKAELEKNWANISRPFQHIFLKASRSLQLETLLDIT
jgi:UDP-N-acetylmuramoyl-tripeptide--D-alanyl-D-alanine ligase